MVCGGAQGLSAVFFTDAGLLCLAKIQMNMPDRSCCSWYSSQTDVGYTFWKCQVWLLLPWYSSHRVWGSCGGMLYQ